MRDVCRVRVRLVLSLVTTDVPVRHGEGDNSKCASQSVDILRGSQKLVVLVCRDRDYGMRLVLLHVFELLLALVRAVRRGPLGDSVYFGKTPVW